jgi:23S rRNA (guanosine2251-2'-O)-methyltransferase
MNKNRKQTERTGKKRDAADSESKHRGASPRSEGKRNQREQTKYHRAERKGSEPRFSQTAQATSRPLVGRNPVRELLLHESSRIIELFVKSGELDRRGREILALAEEKGVRVTESSSLVLDDMSGGAVHQGFLAQIKPQHPLGVSDALKRFAGNKNSLIVAADGVSDPHNLGAMFRAVDCFAADALLWSKNRGTGQTATVAKASAGASELVPFIEVSNLAQSLPLFKEAGYWVVACALDEEAVELASFEWPDKTLLIFGSEGEGIGRLLLERSDFIVKVPMRGRVDSLNVSQATAVFLSDWAGKLND